MSDFDSFTCTLILGMERADHANMNIIIQVNLSLQINILVF